MEDKSLKGKVCFITGSAKGLGRELALRFGREGAVIIGHFYQSKGEAKTLKADLQRFQPQSDVVFANLRSETETKRMIEKVYKRYKHVDILVNNVGNFGYKPISEVTFEEFSDVIESNLYSMFLCTTAVIKRMKGRGSGNIINFGCAGADRVVIHEMTTPYYIAKTGVLMLTKIFANAYAPYGIRVNAISPGVLETSVAEPSPMPSGRYASFDDIWRAIRFLLSPGASYLNGAVIEVAGGWLP